MGKFSGFEVLRQAFSGQKGWSEQWRSAQPKPAYDAIIIGGGGHGLGARSEEHTSELQSP